MNSISKKITLIIVGVIVFFGTIATISVYFYSKKGLVDSKNESLVVNNFHIAEEVGLVFEINKNLVRTISSNKEIVNFLGKIDKSDEEKQYIYELFENFNLSNNYLSIYLMDTEGLTHVSLDKTFEGKNYSFRDYFKNALQGETFMDVAVGVTSGQVGYYFSNPVVSGDNEVIGVVVLKLKPEVVNNIISDKFSNEEIHYFLVDKYGIVLFSDKSGVQFKSMGDMGNTGLSLEDIKNRYSVSSLEELDYDEVIDQLSSYTKPINIRLKDEIDNEEEILTISEIGETGHFLISETELDTISRQVVELALVLSGFVLVAAMFATISISLGVGKILSPINNMKQVAEEISNGNFNKRVAFSSKDELGSLAVSINNMASKLKDIYSSLEIKVRQKTVELEDKIKELEKMNDVMVGRELKMKQMKEELEKN